MEPKKSKVLALAITPVRIRLYQIMGEASEKGGAKFNLLCEHIRLKLEMPDAMLLIYFEGDSRYYTDNGKEYNEKLLKPFLTFLDTVLKGCHYDFHSVMVTIAWNIKSAFKDVKQENTFVHSMN
jgi:hypothetical protein